MEIKKVAVVGSGSMGSAIVEIFAFNGLEVILKDQNIDLVNSGIRKIRKILEKQCHMNMEVMWLLCRLTPDFKTIADFRKNNI